MERFTFWVVCFKISLKRWAEERCCVFSFYVRQKKNKKVKTYQEYSGSVTQLTMNNSPVSKTTKFNKALWWHTNLGVSEPGPGVVVGVGVDRLGLAISSPGICKNDNY